MSLFSNAIPRTAPTGTSNGPQISVHGRPYDISRLPRLEELSTPLDDESLNEMMTLNMVESLTEIEIPPRIDEESEEELPEPTPEPIPQRQSRPRNRPAEQFDEPIERHQGSVQGSAQGARAVSSERMARYDIRGIQLRMYMGSIRPFYGRLKPKLQRILRLELESNIAVLESLYPNYPKRNFKESEDLDFIHTYYENFNLYSAALINAAHYRRIILVISSVMESIAINVGFPKMAGFTSAQLETLPIYESLVLKLSRKHGAGIVEGWPVEIQLAFMMIVSFGVYAMINYYLPTSPEINNRVGTYSQVMNGFGKLYSTITGAFNQAGTGTAPGFNAPTAPVAGIPGTVPVAGVPAAAIPTPISAIPAPNAQPPQLDIMSMLGPMVGQFLPMLMTGFGGTAAPPTPAAPRQRGPIE